MMVPQKAAGELLLALALGCCLGAAYAFLRPLSRRLRALGDLLFLPVLLWAAVYLSFGICAGDPRLPVVLAAGLGWFLWEKSLGRLLHPVFSVFWHSLFRLFRFFARPVAILSKFIREFSKKAYATGKKWGTIKKNHHQKARQKP